MKPLANPYLTGTGIDQFAIDTKWRLLDVDVIAELRNKQAGCQCAGRLNISHE